MTILKQHLRIYLLHHSCNRTVESDEAPRTRATQVGK